MKFFSFLFKTFLYVTMVAAFGCLWLKIWDYYGGSYSPRLAAFRAIINDADRAHVPAAARYLPGNENAEPSEEEQAANEKELAPLTSQITAAAKYEETLKNAKEAMDPSSAAGSSSNSSSSPQ